MSAASENESLPSLAENGRITVLETSDRVSLAPHRVQQHHPIWTQDRLVASFSGFNLSTAGSNLTVTHAHRSSLVLHRLQFIVDVVRMEHSARTQRG